MVIQFMQTRKPTSKQIWRGTHKVYPNIRITTIRRMDLPYGSPIWTVEFIPLS